MFRRLYRLCAQIGLGTAEAAAALVRCFGAGMRRIRRLGRPAEEGKKGVVLALLNYGGPVVTAAALVLTILFWSGRSFGIAVEYGGQTLGYISSEETYDLAAAQINDRLAVRTGDSLLPEPTFSFTLLGNRQVMDETQLADALVAQSAEISEAYGLFLNDELLTTAADGETLRAALDDYLDTYRSGAENERTAFVGCLLYTSYTLAFQWKPAFQKGDLNKDNAINIQDVMSLCRVLARRASGDPPTDDEWELGDINEDEAIDIQDVMSLCRILARQK